MFDRDREQDSSALDEVHAIDRLHTRALRNVDEAMWTVIGRTGKKVETLLPMVLRFEAQLMRPLFENIDAVHYTSLSRVLKVGEEYAYRLLEPRYQEAVAREIAAKLVEDYPEHGFVIDEREAERIGLQIETLTESLSAIVNTLALLIGRLPMPCLGRVTRDGDQQEVS